MTTESPETQGAGQVTAIRPVYQRLMRRRASTAQSQAEQESLYKLLREAPGVHAVQRIEPHPKGGYRVGLLLAWDSLDAFIAALETADWMSVM